MLLTACGSQVSAQKEVSSAPKSSLSSPVVSPPPSITPFPPVSETPPASPSSEPTAPTAVVEIPKVTPAPSPTVEPAVKPEKTTPPPAPQPPPAPTPEPPAPASSGVLWSDNVAGWLSDPKHVPCGGLWKYTSENFYVREITCAGSSRYHALSIGQEVNLGGRTCKMVGKQNLNYLRDDMGDVQWMGNVIVQTCYTNQDRGNVALINFSCD